MKIRMLTSIAGADFALSPGEETERFSDKEAIRFIEAGMAAPIGEVSIERAEKPATAETRKSKSKSKGKAAR